MTNDFSFPDNDYGSAEVGYVSTRCSLAILSLFNSMSAVKVTDGEFAIFLRRLVSQPKVNVRPIVALTRIYDESTSPNQSGLLAACLGLCEKVDITQESMTCLAYSVGYSKESGKHFLSPTINVSDDDDIGSYGHDCRVPLFVSETDVCSLGEVLLNDFHQNVLPKYEEWVSLFQKTANKSRTYFHALQLLSYVLHEFNVTYNGLKTLRDWQYLRNRLVKYAKKKFQGSR
jgi:hypothetical protein